MNIMDETYPYTSTKEPNIIILGSLLVPYQAFTIALFYFMTSRSTTSKLFQIFCKFLQYGYGQTPETIRLCMRSL